MKGRSTGDNRSFVLEAGQRNDEFDALSYCISVIIFVGPDKAPLLPRSNDTLA